MKPLKNFALIAMGAALAASSMFGATATARTVAHRDTHSSGAGLMTVSPLTRLATTARAPNRERSVLAIIAGHRSYEHQPAQNAVPALTSAVKIPDSFLGLSMEDWEMPEIHGAEAAFGHLVNMLRVKDGGPVVLRIGGDSADTSGPVADGEDTPPWNVTPIDSTWLSDTSQILRATGMRTIVDLNGLDHDPQAAALMAQETRAAFPRGSIKAFEIGNEPNLYQTQFGKPNVSDPAVQSALTAYYAWGLQSAYSPNSYVQEWRSYEQAIAQAAPGVPLAGPATAAPTLSRWSDALLSTPDNNLGALTSHLYTLSACANPESHWYPKNERSLLSPFANAQATADLVPFVQEAHAHNVQAVLTEANSVTCGGIAGLSGSFATALWAANALFDMADSGVDAVDIHVRMTMRNPAFVVDGSGVSANPLMYGLAFFSRALTPGATIEPLTVRNAPRRNPGVVHTWLLSTGGGNRVVIVNDDPSPQTVVVKIADQGALTLQTLAGQGLRAQTGETLAGQTIDANGRWTGARQTTTVSYSNALGGYRFRVPGYTAALAK